MLLPQTREVHWFKALYRVSIMFCSHLKDFLNGNNRYKCVVFSTLFLNSESLFPLPLYLDMATDPDHISLISQFCAHFRFFQLSCTKFSNVIHRRSANVTLHIPVQEIILGHDTLEAWERGDWSTIAIPYARKCLVKKCPHIVTLVWWHAILFENDKQLDFFQLWDHTQLITSDTACEPSHKRNMCLSPYCAPHT